MERYNLNFFLLSLHLLLFTLFTCSPTASSTNLTTNSLQDEVCKFINCGQGTCKPTAAFPGFECECYSGWKKIEIGPLTFPACVIPNCTIDFGCGNGSAPAPPPPIALPPPPLNFSDPCNFVWCGDGTCKANGTGHTCQCNEGLANLFNVTDFACFKQCYFGADCHGLTFGRPPPPPSPQSSSSAGNDSTGSSNSARKFYSSILTLLAATFLTWL